MYARDRSNNVFHLQYDDGQLDAWTILDIKLPWSHLTALHLENIPMPPNFLLILLRNITRTLFDASLQVDFDSHGTGAPASSFGLITLGVPQVTMTRLRKLALLLVGERLDEHFFTHIRVPQLKKLRVVTMVSKGCLLSFLYPVIASSARKVQQLELVADSSCQLQSTPPATYVELEALLESVPNLHTLRLPRNVYLHNTTLNKLASGTLLPSLQVLEVTTSSLENAEDILSMLMRRMIRDSSSAGPSNVRDDGDKRSEEPVSPITFVVLSMPAAERAHFMRDTLSRYPLANRCVRIRLEGWS
ncbi:hypothetical protein NLJ89_g4997 [Agrocybe chaxingu]|uniref:Uncharacterized protein n=1 Tax=Agrocybe chaxingu TaxID=84603 RepID=A0A9W8K241_9AGAR|nr:hypothetical protein NLJ89_g4997 [Agrocybe chaxingu]